MNIYDEIRALMPNPYSKNQLYTDGKKVFYSTGRTIHALLPKKSKALGVYVIEDYKINKNGTAEFHHIIKTFVDKQALREYVHGLQITKVNIE